MMLTRRSALSLLAAAPIGWRAFGSMPESSTRLYLGTYTDPVGTTPGGKGLYTCLWDPKEGKLGKLELAAITADPSFLARSVKTPDRLFAVNETNDPNGTVTAFAFLPGKTNLQELNAVSSGGNGPCHLALDHTGQALFVANYGGGSLSSFKVNRAGLSEAISTLRFSGHSVDPERQATPHTHCVRLSPDNRFLLVNDLGLDRIMVFHVDPSTAMLAPASTPFYSATPGSGPRHSLFHPHRSWVYSVNELNSTIDVLHWDSSEGVLSHKETISSLPPHVRQQKNAPAELAVDSFGKFLYVSNRFHDSIGVFSIDQRSGILTAVQDIPCGGKTPRHFALDPTGRWVIVANQDSRNVVVFARNRTTGKLTGTGREYFLDAPVCILFA